MGAFFAYTLYSGVFLLLLYLLYRLFLSGEKQIALNRIILLGCYAAAFSVWPISTTIGMITAPKLENADTFHIGEVPYDRAGNPVEPSSSPLPSILLWIYLAGVVITLAWTLLSIIRLVRYIRHGKKIDNGDYRIIVMPDDSISPCSFGKFIVLGKTDYETAEDTIIAHEAAHIRKRHFLDLLFAQTVCVVCWYNPCAWLMRDELGLIHEYQADAEVLESGADPKQYQMLLIMKTMGSRFHTLANSFSHSKLKYRIAMMQKDTAHGTRRMRAMALVLAPAIAFAIVNIPAVASGLSGMKRLELNGSYGSVLQMQTEKGWEDVPEEETVWITLTPGGSTTYIVNGKPLTEETEINLRNVKKFVTTGPNEEYPGGLWTIEL